MSTSCVEWIKLRRRDVWPCLIQMPLALEPVLPNRGIRLQTSGMSSLKRGSSSSNTFKRPRISDIFEGDLDKHAVQDKPCSPPLTFLQEDPKRPYSHHQLVMNAVLNAFQVEDFELHLNCVDLPSQTQALQDEGLREVISRCYLSRTYTDLRNHRMFALTLPSVTFHLPTLYFSCHLY